jgi:hypothetical protein
MKVLCDVVCFDCKVIKEDVRLEYQEEPTDICPRCSKPMTRKPAFGSFELKYNNKTDMCDWTGETSQYWRSFNEARSRGENVKPADET